MPNLTELLQHGSANFWIFIPTAIILGALHGLEPGHSKTMMAAFIVAIRGTVGQAVLLGLSAAISHSLIIWVLAAGALHFGPAWNAETTEPYLQIASAVLILGLAAWMFWRTRRDVQAAAAHHHHDHHDGVGPQGGKMIDTGHGWVEVSVYETDVPPRFRLHFYDDARKPSPAAAPSQYTIEIVRPDGKKEKFTFDDREEFLEATAELGEPHEFAGKLTLAHGDHVHGFSFHFAEDHDHHHSGHNHLPGGETSAEYEDAHQKAHAADIAQRFAGRNVTTSQIVYFGLTGGLIPCPASLTVLLVCLQLKKFTLGFTLVLSFSFGLAATMVLAGTLAALSVRQAERHFKGFGEFARRAPYLSCLLLVLMAGYLGYAGFSHLPR